MDLELRDPETPTSVAATGVAGVPGRAVAPGTVMLGLGAALVVIFNLSQVLIAAGRDAGAIRAVVASAVVIGGLVLVARTQLRAAQFVMVDAAVLVLVIAAGLLSLSVKPV